MRMSHVQLLRDASGRLTAEVADVSAKSYRGLAKKVAEHFDLSAVGVLIVGLDEAFQEYALAPQMTGGRHERRRRT